MNAPGAASPGAALGQRYRLEYLVGHGGSATVFRAWDRLRCAHVAIKLPATGGDLAPWRSAHLLREVAAAADLAHPSLVRLLDWGVARETPYLAYEYLAGGSLGRRLRTSTLTVTDLLQIAGRVASGLAALHRRGWVHGDVKPANILFDRAGLPRLTDFGLARRIGEPAREEGRIFATAPFAPGEQRRGAPLTPAVDTFSLCAVLYSGITGRCVPAAAAAEGVEALVLRELHTIHPDLELRLGALLARGLAPDPAFRYPEAEALAHALRAASIQPLPALAAIAPGQAEWINARTMAEPTGERSDNRVRATRLLGR